MSKRPSSLKPGTVSNILWHFTGGPDWDSSQRKQSDTAKPAKDAYANLKAILRTRELRLGSYKEVINVTLPPQRFFSKKTGNSIQVKRKTVEVESSPICCVADIPSPHLGYHAYRYGKFAIGFHREAVVRAGFNPVFYTLHDAKNIVSIYRGFAALNRARIDSICDAANSAQGALLDLDDGRNDTNPVNSELDEILNEAEVIGKRLSTARKSLENFVAFVKTFDKTEFNNIYCEREWRSLQPFAFDFDDIAMVVVPRKVGADQYFRRFVEKSKVARQLPRRIPIVPWDELVES